MKETELCLIIFQFDGFTVMDIMVGRFIKGQWRILGTNADVQIVNTNWISSN